MSVWSYMFKTSSLYALPVLASRLISVIMLPVFTRALKPADYGVLELASTTFLVAELLLGSNFAEALPYFYARANGPDPDLGRRRAVQTAFTGSLVIGAFGMAAGWLLSGTLSAWTFGSAAYRDLFLIGFAGFIGSLPFSVATNVFRVADRPQLCVGLGLSRMLLNALLTVALLAGTGLGVKGVLAASSLAVVLCAAACGVYIVREFGFGFDRTLFTRQFRYSLPLSISGLGMTFIHYGDRYFLQRYTSLDAIALYGIAYKIGMMVSFVHGPFLFFWTGHMFQVADAPEGKAVVQRLLTYLALGLTATAVVFSLFAMPTLRILTTPAYYGAAAFVPWLLLAYTIRALGDQMKSVFNLHGKTWEHTLVSLTGVVTSLVFYGALIPPYGVAGAVTATVLSFAVMFVVILIRAQAVDRHDYEWSRISLLTLLSAAAVGLHSYWSPSGFWMEILTGTAVFVIWAGTLVWSGVIQPAERQRLAGLFRDKVISAVAL